MKFELVKKTLGRVFRETAAAFGKRQALVHHASGTWLSWNAFGESVERAARALLACGVGAGDAVAVMSPNRQEWAVMMFAAAMVGVRFVTVNTGYRGAELAYLLRQSDARMLFYSAGGSGRNIGAAVEAALQTLHAGRGTSGCRLERAVFFDGQEEGGWGESLPWADFLALAKCVPCGELEAAEAAVRPDDVVNIQYTSGTTGVPKGVMLTHAGILNNALAVSSNLDMCPEDVICLPVPLFHCVGCVLGLLAAVCRGASVVLLDSMSPVTVMETVRAEKATLLYGVPSFYRSVLRHRHFDGFDCGSLRGGIIAGALCTGELMREISVRMGMKGISNCYGLTEGSPVLTQTSSRDDELRQMTTAGRGLPGIEVAVLSPAGDVLPPGVRGEVCCRGYNVMAGYYGMPEETSKVIDSDGWLHTGDVGVMDGDGYLSICGRIKDLIIRGGENVSPSEVEKVIAEMEGVADVQVVGVPSAVYGEDIAAFIIARDGYDPTAATVRSWCKGRISWFKVPRFVACLDAFPMTSSGKVRKYMLREMAEELFGGPAKAR